MTNYQNHIMDLLQGETPKQKYDFLQRVLKTNILEMDWVESKQDTPVIDVGVLIAWQTPKGIWNYDIAYMDGDEEWFCNGDETELDFIPDYWAYIQKPKV